MARQSISRSYRSELRRSQAEQTRARVVAAAAELFGTKGYAGTTLAKIAAAAGVSPETVQVHGPKAALMKAAIEYVALGVTDKESVFDLEIGRRLLATEDFDEAIDYVVARQTEINVRAASLILALAAAATVDPALDAVQADVVAGITLQVRRVLEVCRDRGWLREDVPFDELVETAAVLGSAEAFERVVKRDGFTVDAYASWVRRLLTQTVFRPDLCQQPGP